MARRNKEAKIVGQLSGITRNEANSVHAEVGAEHLKRMDVPANNLLAKLAVRRCDIRIQERMLNFDFVIFT